MADTISNRLKALDDGLITLLDRVLHCTDNKGLDSVVIKGLYGTVVLTPRFNGKVYMYTSKDNFKKQIPFGRCLNVTGARLVDKDIVLFDPVEQKVVMPQTSTSYNIQKAVAKAQNMAKILDQSVKDLGFCMMPPDFINMRPLFLKLMGAYVRLSVLCKYKRNCDLCNDHYIPCGSMRDDDHLENMLTSDLLTRLQFIKSNSAKLPFVFCTMMRDLQSHFQKLVEYMCPTLSSTDEDFLHITGDNIGWALDEIGSSGDLQSDIELIYNYAVQGYDLEVDSYVSGGQREIPCTCE